MIKYNNLNSNYNDKRFGAFLKLGSKCKKKVNFSILLYIKYMIVYEVNEE